MTPDTGILTQLLQDFRNVFTAGVGFIKGDASTLLGILILIDLILALLLNLDDGDHIKTLIRKTLKYGVFIGIVLYYRDITNIILEGFKWVGLTAGGGGISEARLSDPSSIAEFGAYITKPIFDHIASFTGMDAMFNLGDILTSLIMGLLIIGCFFIIGIQIFITYLEFYIVGCLALILVPFGANKYTAFVGEKAIGAVLSFGVKLMVLSFIASAAIPLISQWTLPEDPTLQQCMYTLLGSAAIAFLAFHAPGVASGLLSGAPSLSAGTAASSALASGMGAVFGTKAALGAVGSSVGTVGAVAQAAKIGHATGGGISGAIRGVGSYAMAQTPYGQGQMAAQETMMRQMHASRMMYRLRK